MCIYMLVSICTIIKLLPTKVAFMASHLFVHRVHMSFQYCLADKREFAFSTWIWQGISQMSKVMRVEINLRRIPFSASSTTERLFLEMNSHIDGVILKPRIENFSENQNHVCSSHVKIKTSYEVFILYTTYEVFYFT